MGGGGDDEGDTDGDGEGDDEGNDVTASKWEEWCMGHSSRNLDEKLLVSSHV